MKFLLCLFTLAVPAFGTISISLPGTSESASWTLTSAVHPGFNSFGTAANPWATAVSPDAGTASAALTKVSGSGYIGGTFLYTAGSLGSFRISDIASLSALETVVFQGKISDPLASIVLNYNGGSQALPADFSVVVAGSGYPDRGWQWDLSGVAGISSYEILISGHFAANAMAVTAGDSFVQVIPEPSVCLLGFAALGFTLTRRRRA